MTKHIARTTPPKEEAIREITTLQNAHRLGIHMFESWDINHQSQASLEALEESAENIEASVKHGEMKFLSLSLLPASTGNPIALGPFMAKRGFAGSLGFLFDLRQDVPNGSTIPRIQESTLISYGDSSNKNFRVNRIPFSFVPEIKNSLPEGLSSEEEPEIIKKALVNRSYTPEGRKIAEKQLDALGAFMQSCPPVICKDDSIGGDRYSQTLNINELLVGASKSHIKAIAIASYPKDTEIPRATYDALVTLNGAVSGLMHLQQGMNLPVLVYNVKEPNVGDCTWLGQGEVDLRQKAIEAIKTVQQAFPENTQKHLLGVDTPHFDNEPYSQDKLDDMLKKYAAKIQELTGIDVNKPVKDQLRTINAKRTPAVSMRNKG